MKHIDNILSRLKGKKKYRHGNFFIELPHSHTLPKYREKHKNYDQFLPHLVSYFSNDSLVVDVGANCGDSLAIMASTNPDIHYLCIEPDIDFFRYLTSNIKIIQPLVTQQIIAVQALVGTNNGKVTLIGDSSTKRATKADTNKGATYQSITLDKILVETPNATQLKLIKCDVDGFDFDVLNSAKATIKSTNPLLFFECDFRTKDQLEKYLGLLSELRELGYTETWLFDNFGEPLIKINDQTQLILLFDYIWRQHSLHATRTIYYFDIFTFTAKDAQLSSRIIEDYFHFIRKEPLH